MINKVPNIYDNFLIAFHVQNQGIGKICEVWHRFARAVGH